VTQQIGDALADRYGNVRALVVVTLMITLGLALRPVATDLWSLVVGAWAV
jgi:cyanate permease